MSEDRDKLDKSDELESDENDVEAHQFDTGDGERGQFDTGDGERKKFE